MKKTLQVGGQNGLEVSAIALGCMHLAELDVGQADALVRTALDCGVTYFDHADIYGGGGSEELFGRVLEKDPALREWIISVFRSSNTQVRLTASLSSN